MRIVHTSDWHAGRIWKGRNRLPELQDVLEHLGDFIERERIDLVLMTGDVFDSTAPPAEAERAVTSFFRRLGQAAVPSVVIAGNHDSPARLEAWGLLAEFVGVTVRGLPRRRSDGGLIELAGKNGQRAHIAAVPFAPIGRLVEALMIAHDETMARQQYGDAMQRIFAHLAEGFRPDVVNLAMGHAHVAGAQPTGSERVVTLGDDWAATPQALPTSAQYVALGHIHRPQRIAAAGAHAEFAGSPMQLDFGEVQDGKTFAVVEVLPGKPPKVDHVPYEGGARLGSWAGSLQQLEQQVESLKAYGYLRVRVSLTEPSPDLNRRVRQWLPNVVVVETVLPDQAAESTASLAESLAPVDRFRAFYQRQHQREPNEATLALFNDLYAFADTE